MILIVWIFIYINKNQRGKDHGRRLMKPILNHFPVDIHTLYDSLGFFERISKDFGLEKINTGMHFGIKFISSKLNINRQPVVNSCLGGCRLKFSGYKRYVCQKCSVRFVRENIDRELIRLNDSLRSKLRKEYQPCVIAQLTMGQTMKILGSDIDQEYKKSLSIGML